MSGNLRCEVMTERDLEAVARLHQQAGGADWIVPESLRFEYFDNPDPGSVLYFSADPEGRVVASQAFIAQFLIRRGERHLTMMSERTLLEPSLRGKGGFSEFYEAALQRSCASRTVEFIWGGTTAVRAFQRFGFEVCDCFFNAMLVLSVDLIRSLLSSPESTGRQKLFYGLAYALSRVKRLLRGRRAGRAGQGLRMTAEYPEPATLSAFLTALCAANPDSFFMECSTDKLDWFVRRNRFREREGVFFWSGEKLTGLAILEREKAGVAAICEFLVLEREAIEMHFAALTDYMGGRGIRGARFFGNAENPYLARLRNAFFRLGAVAIPTNAHLVIRTADPEREQHPAVSELAMTLLWGPPV